MNGGGVGGGGGIREREVAIFDKFSRIVRDKFASVANDPNGGERMKNIDELYKSPDFNAEKKALNKLNNMGLSKGVAWGLGTFALLRLGPGTFSRMIVRLSGGGANNPFRRPSSGYKFDQPVAGQPPDAKPPGLLFRLVRLSVDAFVSLSVGAYASLHLVDKDEMMSQFSEIPLIEGRSLLAEELCDDFATEFRRFDRGTWDAHHRALTGGSSGGSRAADAGDGTSGFRDAIQGFVANCRRREMYEEELRRERGMGGSEPVAIPAGGVPRDASVSLDDLMRETGFDDGDGVDGDLQVGDDYFDTSFDMGDGGKGDSQKPPAY